MSTESSCLDCGAVIPLGRTVCGQACAARYNSKQTAHLRRSRARCKLCDRVTTLSGDLCRRHEKDRLIILGQVSGPVALRAWLIRERGRRCERCGNTHWLTQPIPLELDHINGNSTINMPDNIRLLCANCHSLTPTFKARNKGNGRASRRITPA